MPDTISQQQKQKQKKYESYVKKVTPAHSLPLNMGKAFLTGGIICTLGQFILNTAKSMGADKETAGTWCSVILIFLSVEYKAEGQVFGIGCKIFTIAGPVILYGLLSSWILGIFYYILKLMEVIS